MSGPTLAASGADVSLSGSNQTLIIVVAVIALIALAMALMFRGQVLAAHDGTESMKTIGRRCRRVPRRT